MKNECSYIDSEETIKLTENFAPTAVWPPQNLHGLDWYRNGDGVTVMNIELMISEWTA
jgi:hypothetical protein